MRTRVPRIHACCVGAGIPPAKGARVARLISFAGRSLAWVERRSSSSFFALARSLARSFAGRSVGRSASTVAVAIVWRFLLLCTVSRCRGGSVTAALTFRRATRSTNRNCHPSAIKMSQGLYIFSLGSREFPAFFGHRALLTHESRVTLVSRYQDTGCVVFSSTECVL